MAQAGKRPTKAEKILLMRSGKDPSDWLKIKEHPESFEFRHRIQESKIIIIDKD